MGETENTKIFLPRLKETDHTEDLGVTEDVDWIRLTQKKDG
jgi:hypothetical protein